jgi:hypothetical protein
MQGASLGDRYYMLPIIAHNRDDTTERASLMLPETAMLSSVCVFSHLSYDL